MVRNFFRSNVVTGVLFGLLLCAFSQSVYASSTNLTYFKSLDLIRKVLELIKSDYVEENIDEQKLIYGAIEGMLKKLDDPYTRVMEPKSFKEMQVETQGEFGGLGIVISIKDRSNRLRPAGTASVCFQNPGFPDRRPHFCGPVHRRTTNRHGPYQDPDQR